MPVRESRDHQAMSDRELDDLLAEDFAALESRGRRPRRLGEAGVPAGSAHISMRIPLALVERVKREADRRGMPYQRLMKTFITEGLRAEHPPSLPPYPPRVMRAVRELLRSLDQEVGGKHVSATALKRKHRSPEKPRTGGP